MIKRLLILILMQLPLIANAYIGEVEIDGIKYDISTKEQIANVIGPSSSDISGALMIPSSIEYEGKLCYVKSVGGFESCTGITSVSFAEGIECINRNAFQNCSNLLEINPCESIREVGRYAFDGTAWFNIQEDGVVYLAHVALRYKGDMPEESEISIKEGTKVIANYCFSDVENLKSIHFPESLISIGESAFVGCRSLTSVTLNNIDIHYRSFAVCQSLKEVNLSNVRFVPNINIYGQHFTDYFGSSDAIESVYIDCKEVDDWFRNKKSITKVTFSDNVEVINPGAFSSCTGIEQIEFPNSIKYLSGFADCTGITSISIPTSVETIGGEAFWGCSGITSLDIPSNVKHIDNEAFRECSNLAVLNLSEGLKSIGGRAFANCTSLISIDIPNSVDTIGSVYSWIVSKRV